MKVVAVLASAKKRRLQRNNSMPLSPHGSQQHAEEPAPLQRRDAEPQRTVTFSALPTPSPAAAASASVLHGGNSGAVATPMGAAHSAASLESLDQLRQADSITSQCSATSAGCALTVDDECDTQWQPCLRSSTKHSSNAQVVAAAGRH